MAVDNIIDVNNIVFKILKTDTPDIYNLYCIDENSADKNTLYKHSNALVPNIKISHYLYNTFKSNPNNLGLQIECKYSKIFEKWTPVTFVNNASYTKTQVDIIEERCRI